MAIQLITKYFPNLDNSQIESFTKLDELYKLWNDQINVISRKDIDSLYERHVLHSLAIAKVISFKPATTILDVGTGGGFPGIPLAIHFPEVQFHLVDSIGKKIKAVKDITSQLGLTNVTSEQIRAEQIKDQYDFIVSRAVIRMKPFLQWIKNKVRITSSNSLRNGVIALKGGDLAQELSEINRKYDVVNISDHFEEEFFETKKIIHIPLPK